VAIKVMELQASKHWKMVRHELDVGMMLQHPNVVRCYDYQILQSKVSMEAAWRAASQPCVMSSRPWQFVAGKNWEKVSPGCRNMNTSCASRCAP
jgi:hypothetical protein